MVGSEWERLVKRVGSTGDKFGSALKEMLDYYDVNTLEELTLQEIKEYLINVLDKT